MFSVYVLSDDDSGVFMSFFDVDPSDDVEVILCEVEKLSRVSVVSVFSDVDEFSSEVVVIFDDDAVILNLAPSNCSISSGSYGKTHCMPSGKSVNVLSSAKQSKRSIWFDNIKLGTCLCKSQGISWFYLKFEHGLTFRFIHLRLYFSYFITSKYDCP